MAGPAPALLKWGGQSQGRSTNSCNRCNRSGKGTAAIRPWGLGAGGGNFPPTRSAEAQRIWHVYVAQKALHITLTATAPTVQAAQSKST